MKCLETRTRADGLRRRRYRLDDGRTTVTIEMPMSVFRALITNKRLAVALVKFQRGEALRARGQRIDTLIREGHKPTAIAHEVGVSEAAVRLRRKIINQEKK